MAIDPVLLAATIEPERGARVLDLGCGVGGAALCLLARLPETRVTGWEVQPDLAALAVENAALNGCADRFVVVTRDALTRAADDAGAFDQVLTNPPYHGPGTPAGTAGEALATRGGDPADWIAAARRALRPRGSLTVIYRADRLAELLAALSGGFGGIVIHPIWPRAGRPANRVLARAVKGVRAPLSLGSGLTLHGDGPGFSPSAEAILRAAAALPI